MGIKQKWDELDKRKKALVGAGSALVVVAAGVGGTAIALNGGDQPAQTKVADASTNTNRNKEADKTDSDKDDEKKKLDDKSKDGKKESDKDQDKKDSKKEDNKKETVTEKEDGTKVKVSKSSGNTPSATVKVEKNSDGNSKGNSTSDSSSASSTSGNSAGSGASSNNSKASSTSNASSGSTSSSSKPANKTTTKTTTATESIAFETVRQNDSSLAKGQEKTVQNGQNGTRTITYKETYVNGKLSSKEQVSSNVTKQPVNKIVKVGTKEAPKAPTYISASQAHSILSGSGMTKRGSNEYALTLGQGTDVIVKVGGSHVSSIYFNADNYIPWKTASKSELIEALGKKEGTESYEYGQAQAAKIERAVRSAANATYGSGSSKANSLYSQIINSGGYSKSF